jgi:iron complex transport system permease protein
VNSYARATQPGSPPASPPGSAPGSTLMVDDDAHRRSRLGWALAAVVALGLAAGLATGSGGFSPAELWAELHRGDAGLILGQIRAPRTLGAALVGALLGLSGALAQGLFRNPLADPYLLGSSAGAGLGVVLVLAAGSLAGGYVSLSTAIWLERVGLVTAAFAGALPASRWR